MQKSKFQEAYQEGLILEKDQYKEWRHIALRIRHALSCGYASGRLVIIGDEMVALYDIIPEDEEETELYRSLKQALKSCGVKLLRITEDEGYQFVVYWEYHTK